MFPYTQYFGCGDGRFSGEENVSADGNGWVRFQESAEQQCNAVVVRSTPAPEKQHVFFLCACLLFVEKCSACRR